MSGGIIYRRTRNISKIVRFSEVRERVSFGYTVYHPGGECGPRLQSRFQIMGILEGTARIQADDRQWRMNPGQVGLLCPGRREFHTLSATHTTHQIWCTIHPSLMPPSLRDACHQARTPIKLTRRLQQVMELGRAMPRTTGPRGQMLMESLALTALYEYLFAEEAQPRAEAEPPDALRQAVEWVEIMGKHPLDLAELARRAGVSPGQLNKLFRRHLNTSPMRYLWDYRTREGATLLRETNLTVAEVAYRCGFQTPFHFSRLVHRHFGVAPSQLRAKPHAPGAAQGPCPDRPSSNAAR